MTTRTFASFDWSTLPANQTDANIGDIPPGKEVMDTIHLALVERGFVVTEVEQHSSYGWSFYIKIGEVFVWTMLQLSDSWLLVSDAPIGLLKRLIGRSNNAALTIACAELHAALSSTTLAQSIRWFTRDEFAKNPSGGVSEP